MPNANTQHIEITKIQAGIHELDVHHQLRRLAQRAIHLETGLILPHRSIGDRDGMRLTQGMAVRVNDPRLLL